MVADGGVRRARQPALPDDGRDVRLGDPRVSRSGSRSSSRTSAGSRAARRRRAQGSRRRVRGRRRSRRRSASPATTATSSAPRRARVRRARARSADASPTRTPRRSRWPRAATRSTTPCSGASPRRPPRSGIDDAAAARARRARVGDRCVIDASAPCRRGLGSRRSSSSPRSSASCSRAGWSRRGSWSTSSSTPSSRSRSRRRALPIRGVAGERLRLRLPGADRSGVPLFASIPTAYASRRRSTRRDVARGGAGVLPRAPRRLDPRLALVAAVLTVAVPSMVYTGTLMTENAFYPLFLVASLGARLDARAADVVGGRSSCSLLLRARVRDARAGGGARAGDRCSRRCCSRSTRALARASLTARCSIARRRRCRARRRSAELVRGRSPLACSAPTAPRRARTTPSRRCSRWLALPRRRARSLCRRRSRSPRCSLLAASSGASPAPRAFAAATLPLTRAARRRGRGVRVDASVQRIEERNMFYVAPFALHRALCCGSSAACPRPARRTAAAALCALRSPAASRSSGSSTRRDLGHVRRCCRWW